MLRLLTICALIIASTARTAVDTRVQPAQAANDGANNAADDGKAQTAREASDVVRKRFALATEARSCRPWDNLYGYNLLLQQFTEAQQRMLRTAEAEGRQQGLKNAPAADAKPACAADVRSLDAADTQLLILAEQAAVAKPH